MLSATINKSARAFRALARRVFLFAALTSWVQAKVVINEVFYHAPGELEDLEFIELYNSGDSTIDLAGWKFTKGIKFKFPPGSRIRPDGYLVFCRSRQRFSEFYDAPIAGTFDQKLSNDGEAIELADAEGKVIDQVEYRDKEPWPPGADGVSGSLERICPDASSSDPWNWSSSPLSVNQRKPGGTPGYKNVGYSPELPPVVTSLKINPENPQPGQAITFEATTRETNALLKLTLLYRSLSAGDETSGASFPMQQISPGQFSATIPGQLGNRLLRYRVGVRNGAGASRFFPGPNEPRPAMSVFISGAEETSRIPQVWIFAPPGSESSPGPRRWRGPRFRDSESPSAPYRSAFVYYDSKVRKFEVFDFVQVVSRSGGWKVRLGKNQLLQQMSTLNIIFETDRGTLAEPLAYELYRMCGMAASQSWHVRLHMNGQPLGYHLLFEQPNRAFLRRNDLSDDGNLYKILWYERGIVGQHEKKTRTGEGHDDVIALIKALESTQGAAQWEVIRKNFEVRQVATYFAVNTVLSHWDGFFNNYFTYHDLNGTGKWTMYPWDQDQTWGIINGADGSVFYTMPLSFGMAGDVPPGERERRAPGGADRFAFGRGGPGWWRPGGYFSSPLLANPRFREVFLARTRSILENIYTPEKMNPLIDSMANNLRDEVKIRSELVGGDVTWEMQQFERNIRALKTHVVKRREFLLSQPEIKSAAALP